MLKMLVMLEGTSRLASPRFSLMDMLRPHQKEMMWRRISPLRRFRKLRRIYTELEHMAEILPRKLLDMVDQLQAGKFDVHLEHRGLQPSVNRLVLGMLTSALFLGSALLYSREVPPLVSERIPLIGSLIGGVSFFGLTGCLLALGLGLRLMRAINKSGHVDRRD